MISQHRYEFRFPNGDTFFSEYENTAFLKRSIMAIDHLCGSIVKNRFGSTGKEEYTRMFPQKKHENTLFS